MDNPKEIMVAVNEAEARFVVSLLARVEAPVLSDRREAIVGLIKRIEKCIEEAKEKPNHDNPA